MYSLTKIPRYTNTIFRIATSAVEQDFIDPQFHSLYQGYNKIFIKKIDSG